MNCLLDLVYILLIVLLTPVILVRACFGDRWRAGWLQRFGFVPKREGAAPCVWIHAVSVGEVSLIRDFVEHIRDKHPDWDIAVSTFTNTGQKIARERFGRFATVFYYPLDVSWIVWRVMRRVRPDVIALVELEIWPNFVRVAARRGVPIVIVNGRMREEKVARYARLRPLFGPLRDARTRNVYCVQNEVYADRFRRAGFPGARIRVLGAMKYDAAPGEIPSEELDALRKALGLAPEDRAWIGACTWPGEEAVCLRAHRRLIEAIPGLRLILAPRHVERAGRVEAEIRNAGFSCRRRSAGAAEADPGAVALLDTVGELTAAYALTSAAFVGRSLTESGGHNTIEPASLGVPVLFGPHTDNFPDETRLLLDAGAAKVVRNENDLYNALFFLLSDNETNHKRGDAGREAVRRNLGATDRHISVLRELLGRRSPRGSPATEQ